MTLEAKDPNAVLDYTADWSRWLGDDTIVTSTWILTGGLTEVSSSNTDTSATVFVSGGTAGSSYEATNRITTAGGRTNDRTLRIPVRNR